MLANAMSFGWVGEHIHIWLPPFVGFVVWLARLESKTKHNTDDIKDTKKDIESLKDVTHSLEIVATKLETLAGVNSGKNKTDD